MVWKRKFIPFIKRISSILKRRCPPKQINEKLNSVTSAATRSLEKPTANWNVATEIKGSNAGKANKIVEGYEWWYEIVNEKIKEMNWSKWRRNKWKYGYLITNQNN